MPSTRCLTEAPHDLATGVAQRRRARQDGDLGPPMTLLLASARTEVADYLATLIYVYTLLIIVYIVVQLLFAFGVRPPYSRASDAVLSFLRDVCEPYLRIFRRIIPMVGAFDFSPIVAIIVLSLVGNVIVSLIHG
jgi:YggT family protein